MTSATRTGSVRWIKRLQGDFGRLAITSNTRRGPVVAEYDVQVNRSSDDVIDAVLLVQDDDRLYTVSHDLPGCTCPDAARRGTNCKHQRAIAAAFKAL